MNFYQDVFFRGLDRLRGRQTIERLKFLRRSQFWGSERLYAWQLERLNALLEQARRYSPYHREALKAVRLPLTTLAAVEDLPILTKQNIRENLDAIKCGNLPASRFIMSRTGGSTAEPMFYYWDKRGMDWNRASVYRSAEWAGTALGERTLQMSGSHFDYTESQKLFNRIVYLLQRYRDCPISVITDGVLASHYRTLMSFRPTAIWGYASGIAAFADYAGRCHPGTDYGFLRALATSSETLRPEQRRRIEEVFGAGKVFDQYGSREMYIGAECRAHRGYHLHAEALLVEVVDRHSRRAPPGERGRVLLTDLSNHAFPFIRYEIGDVGVMADDGPCPCGVNLPRLAAVEGRIADMIVLRDRMLSPPNFATLFSDLRGIKAYQIRQDSLDEIRVLLVPDRDYDAGFASYVTGAIAGMAGEGVRVVLQEVSEIPVPESGKRRFIVSSVSREQL